MYGGPYLISDQWLPVLVRQMALHANVSHAHPAVCVRSCMLCTLSAGLCCAQVQPHPFIR